MLEELGRDELVQLWILGWILVGIFGNYLYHKGTLKGLTAKGCIKKLIIGVLAWGIFLGVYWHTDLKFMDHISIILPTVCFGITAERFVGGWLQQKIEGTSTAVETEEDAPEVHFISDKDTKKTMCGKKWSVTKDKLTGVSSEVTCEKCKEKLEETAPKKKVSKKTN